MARLSGYAREHMASRHRPGLIFAAAATSTLVALAGCGSSSKSTTESTPAAATPVTTASTPATTATTSSAPATPATTTKTTPPAPVTSAATLALAADPTGNLKFTKSALTAKGTSVAIVFTNKSPLEHNLTVESASGQQLGATPTFVNATHTLKLANLKPGTYTFFCSVPGHRAAGMHGTLTVSS
jgi:uncharacterized cupredoxin-like copper-binding protein